MGILIVDIVYNLMRDVRFNQACCRAVIVCKCLFMSRLAVWLVGILMFEYKVFFTIELK